MLIYSRTDGARPEILGRVGLFPLAASLENDSPAQGRSGDEDENGRQRGFRGFHQELVQAQAQKGW